MLDLCPPFARLYRAVQVLLAAMTVPCLAYFSGGGGFRVLFDSPHAWRTVTWGHTYAATFHAHELGKLLMVVAPTLPADVLARIQACTDKNIYDCDKGTKPDLLAHFDTGLWPRLVDETFEAAIPSRDTADANLSASIRSFWNDIFLSIPQDPPLPLVADIAEPALVRYPNPLWSFEKCSDKTKATHLALQGKKTSYRRVHDTKELYRLMVEQRQRGQPLNVHEIRTKITRHAIDYDGGPPLLDLLPCTDGTMKTVLHAIQEIGHTVLQEGNFSGLLLTCPPRPGTVGCRAHLIWPDWYVPLEHEQSIVIVIRRDLQRQWPAYDWNKIIESPIKLRMLFSDTMDKRTGLMANRPMLLDSVFDVRGHVMDRDMAWPRTTDMELLARCSLRCADDQPLAKLLPLPVSTHVTAGTHADLKVLAADMHKAVVDTLNGILDDIRIKHDKPKAHFYDLGTLKINMTKRILKLGILNHHQCTEETTHHNNNVFLVVCMDRPQWYLNCPKRCPRPQWDDWSRGMADTTALRLAWPLPPPKPQVEDIETPPPSPPRVMPEPKISIIVFAEQWDGEYVIIKEKEIPTEWSCIRLVHERDHTREYLMSFELWSDGTRVKRYMFSRMHPYPVRIVPLALLATKRWV